MNTDDRGTEVTFKPDGTIFTEFREYNYETLASQECVSLSYLNQRYYVLRLLISVTKMKKVSILEKCFILTEGLKEFIKYLDSETASKSLAM